MARPPRNAKATKHTVRLTINSDVYAHAKRLGINASHVAEEALIQQIARRKAELRAEIEQDMAAIDAYEEKHGSFAVMVRQHDGDNQDCQ